MSEGCGDTNPEMIKRAPVGYAFVEIIIKGGKTHKKYLDEVERRPTGAILEMEAFRANGEPLPVKGYAGIYIKNEQIMSVMGAVIRKRIDDGTMNWAMRYY